METKNFFTTEFYENPELTLEVLNRLVEGKHVANQDMYQNGEFLFMEVYENEDTKKILSSVILNLEAYKAYNNENFVSDGTTQIGLCALQNEHNRFFRSLEGDKEIRWYSEERTFVFSEDMPSRFD